MTFSSECEDKCSGKDCGGSFIYLFTSFGLFARTRAVSQGQEAKLSGMKKTRRL